MYADRICYENFRNIKPVCLELSQGINVISGNNAQGKTNLLEGIWIFSSGKSFRASSDKEMINFNSQYAKLSLSFFARERENNCEMLILRDKRKEIKLNGIKLIKTGELIGNFTTVLFAPEHLNLVKDGPYERRRFIDFSLSQISPKYFSLINEYNKTLEQRNALLKSIFKTPGITDTLDVWDTKLARCACLVTKMRGAFLKRLLPFAKEAHDELSSSSEEFNLKYLWFDEGNYDDEKTTYELFLLKLKKERENDIRNGTTGTGPHRDDIDIEINGRSARRYGSQGQQRSCVLSLKTAEAEIINEEYGEYPLFLLDDVLSELDFKRQEYILSKIKDKQVIVTSCDGHKMSNQTAKFFKIKNGMII